MVNFNNLEEVGQLALQIDKKRGKGSTCGLRRGGGYENITLAKMIELLKPHVKGFPTARSVAFCSLPLRSFVGNLSDEELMEPRVSGL